MIEAICFDLGDTLVAEETVIHNSSGQAITAKVIEGVFEVLKTMRKDGYRTAMIANANSADDKNKGSRLLKGTKATGQGNAKCQRQSER